METVPPSLPAEEGRRVISPPLIHGFMWTQHTQVTIEQSHTSADSFASFTGETCHEMNAGRAGKWI